MKQRRQRYPRSNAEMFSNGKMYRRGVGIWYTCETHPDKIVYRAFARRWCNNDHPHAPSYWRGFGKLSPSKARFERRRLKRGEKSPWQI
jgi:hypothetical protein